MMTKLIPIAVVTGMLLGNIAVYADDTHDPGVNKRQHRQAKRIKQGVKSGELTKHEAKELREDQRDIKTKEQAYKADGKLTNAERKDLQHDLNESSRDIHQEKHDAQTRPNRATRDPAVNARQANQEERIEQGVASGELTHKEARELREEQRDVKQLEKANKSDGKLTNAERKDLHQELNETSEEIHEEKHDAQQR
jgi:uncharacterized protein YoaH (UPF0181 family)